MSRLNNLIDQFKAEDPNIGFNINQTYEEIVTILSASSKLFVPLVKKNFFKFWWNEDLKLLKEESIATDKIWRAFGKPRQGPIFNKRQSAK